MLAEHLKTQVKTSCFFDAAGIVIKKPAEAST